MNTPTITIKGQTATGKTTLAYAFAKFLLENDIKADIVNEDEEHPREILMTLPERLETLSGTSQKNPIKIKTKRSKVNDLK